MEPSEPTFRAVVCDAGPLIHLDELGCIDLLGEFVHVFVPESVWREVGFHRLQALEHPTSHWSELALIPGETRKSTPS